MDIIFVRTRYWYDSYTDFWTLVELSGFETCYVDEVNISKPRVYIVTPMNGEWQPHIDNQMGKPHNAHLVHWCLERPSGSGGMFHFGKSNREHLYARRLDDIWVSDRTLAHETLFRFVVLGSDEGLGAPGDVKQYDFVHMSYLSDRRRRVYDQYPAAVIGPNCWPWDEGPSRDDVLKASRFALNIHQDDYPIQEPLRWALFAAYGLPMLSESVNDACPWHENVCVFNPYDGILGRLKQMLDNDYSRWRDMGLRARDLMCQEKRFRAMVLDAVSQSVHV